MSDMITEFIMTIQRNDNWIYEKVNNNNLSK